MALIDDEPRMANANALTKTVCIVIPGNLFKDKLKRTDPFIGALLRVFVQNIRSTVTHKRASDRE
jgi:CRP-like cAMP-binding protein